MKATPHSYRLSLSQVDKAVLKTGIKNAIEAGKFSVNDPVMMSRALNILGNIDSICLIVTSWETEYILIPALDSVPAEMIEPGMYDCLRNMAARK